jgi:hypothetical protein
LGVAKKAALEKAAFFLKLTLARNHRRKSGNSRPTYDLPQWQ